MVRMKLRFFLELAGMDPDKIDQSKIDMFLSMARDDEVVRVIKDALLLIEADPNQKDNIGLPGV